MADSKLADSKPRPCLLKVNRPDFYMMPFSTSYPD